MQTRDHFLKECPKWKDQQKVLWKEVWKETEKRKWRWKAHKLFADARCSQAVLDFLASTEVGKTVPAAAVEENADTVTLGLSRNRSVGRVKGNQATFDNSQRNNLRSCVWGRW